MNPKTTFKKAVNQPDLHFGISDRWEWGYQLTSGSKAEWGGTKLRGLGESPFQMQSDSPAFFLHLDKRLDVFCLESVKQDH